MVGLKVARSPTVLSVLTVKESEVAQEAQGTGKTLLLFHFPFSPAPNSEFLICSFLNSLEICLLNVHYFELLKSVI